MSTYEKGSLWEWHELDRKRVLASAMQDICANRHKGNEQSVKANQKVEKVKKSNRNMILTIFLHTCATCEQLEDWTGLSHQSCSARISELKRDGLIRKIGTRPTRSGCQAAVYQAV